MNVSSAGDLGDIIALMGIIAEIPDGPHRLFLRDDGNTQGIVKRSHLILPLINSQDYVKGSVWKDEKIHWPSEQFRGNGKGSKRYYEPDISLLESHSSHGEAIGVLKRRYRGEKQWLHVRPSKTWQGRVVVVRSERYRNWRFPWKEIVSHFGDRLLMLGTEVEHLDFCEKFGHVEYLKTKDLLECAKIIAGSDIYIGNQTSLTQIAEGLKHPRIIEINERVPDVLYPGTTNAIWCCDGSMTIPDIPGLQGITIEPKLVRLAPPGASPTRKGWLIPSGGSHSHLSTAAKTHAKRMGISKEEAWIEVYDFSKAANPEWFSRFDKVENQERFKVAVEKARRR